MTCGVAAGVPSVLLSAGTCQPCTCEIWSAKTFHMNFTVITV